MKKAFLIIAMLIAFGASLYAADNVEYYFKFQIDSKQELDKLTRIISIDKVVGNEVYAYANPEEMREFEMMGYIYEELQHPGTLIRPKMAIEKDGMTDWDAYPTYNAYLSMMNQFAADYPGLCEIVNIGTSVEGRALLFAKISDNIGIEEDEPEVMYTGTIHGDETAGYVLSLRLIDYLLTNYGTDSLATRLVDSCEIWINPLANPDGTFNNGDTTVYSATRYNANSKDLNRNFPDPEDGPNPGGTWQPETIAMMNIADAQNFVISANMHGGAEVCNYPWDTWSRLTPDDGWWVDVCRQYADSAQYYSPSGYMTFQNNGITNGYAWYSISGGRQDYMNYFHGCREFTLEMSNTKLLPASQLPAWWTYNKVSMLDYLEQGLYGVRGIVTDNSTGLPILAMVRTLNHDTDMDSSMVYTDPDIGNYHRMLEAGTYDIEFSAPGYYTDTIYSVSVVDLQSTRVDVALVPLPNEPSLAFVSHNGGLIDPGDAVGANITLVNNGAGISYNTAGTLSSTDPYITITQNYSTYPNIGALGGMESSDAQYQFNVSSSCPNNYLATLRLDVTADGYADSIFFDIMVGQQIEDFELGDFSQYPWVLGGDQDWTVQSTTVYNGVYAARSGSITHGQETTLELTAEVITSGDVSFYYKVSSESGYDYLRFYIDGIQQDEWAGNVEWTQVSYPVSAGARTFKWEYAKDGSVSGGSDCGWVDFIVFPPLHIAPDIITISLPDWTVGYAYSEQLVAAGGTGTLTWTDLNNDLDGSGLTLSAGGLLSGTPTSTGTISFTAQVEDTNNETDQQLYTFDINAQPVIQAASLPDWTEGRSYSQQLSATGGTGVLSWTDFDSDLDGTGLTLSQSGLLSGIPSINGTIQFTALVTDDIGATDSEEFSLTINPVLEITTPSVPDGTVGQAYSMQLACSGGTGEKSWNDKYNHLDGSGLTLSGDGLLSGTPTSAGEIGFYAEVEDVTGSKDEKQFAFTINADYICGDSNNDDDVNVSDAVWIINYVFTSGSAPDPLESGDANCDGDVNVSDAVWIINYVFVSGDSPCDTDGDGQPDC